MSVLKTNDLAWRLLKARLGELGALGGRVRVGVFGGEGEGGISLPELAAVHEYGTRDGRIPARSFIASTLRERKTEIAGLLSTLARDVIRGTGTPKSALERLGLQASSWVKQKILRTSIPPPLAASTIKRKGSDRPLVDTGQLVAAITWQVVL